MSVLETSRGAARRHRDGHPAIPSLCSEWVALSCRLASVPRHSVAVLSRGTVVAETAGVRLLLSDNLLLVAVPSVFEHVAVLHLDVVARVPATFEGGSADDDSPPARIILVIS